MKTQGMRKTITTDEADAWHRRNKNRTPSQVTIDAVTEVQKKWFDGDKIGSILELGCSDGRLGLELKTVCSSYVGVDPSPIAVETGITNGLNLVTGWADEFELEQRFDVVILGFFLYLTHPDDWFKIASNIYRHLEKDSYLIINDFYADGLVAKNYKHDQTMNIYKYSYENLFLWHPSFRRVYQSVSSEHPTDLNDTDYWYKTIILKVSK